MKSKYKKILTFIAFFILSAGFGYMIGMLIGKLNINATKTSLTVFLAGIIPAFFMVIAFHEAGHAFAGLKVNFDFRMYVVGPFLWSKEQEKWVFKWNKNVNTAGGLVVCLPTDTYNLNKRFAIYAAGGPIASLISTLIGILLFLFFRSLAPQNQLVSDIFSSFFLLIAAFSVIIFMVTAIPFHSGGFSSDGARVFRILKGGEAARFELLMLKIIALITSGTRPKNIEVSELTEALNIGKKLKLPQAVYLHGLLHQTEFDLGNLEKAEIHLKNYIDDVNEIPAGMQGIIYLDAAFFYAYAMKDLAIAESYWQKFKPNAFVSKAQIFATEASLNFLQNNLTEVTKKIEDCFNEIPNMLDKGNGIALTEKMQSLKRNLA